MKNKIIPYDPKLKALAKELRQNMTLGEVLLWNVLKADKMLGFDFDRQRCIDRYIVDLYCKQLMLAIEIDGRSHEHPENYENDVVRQQRLESLGIAFLRFSEAEVKHDMFNVLRTIESAILLMVKNNDDIPLPKGFDRGALNSL